MSMVISRKKQSARQMPKQQAPGITELSEYCKKTYQDAYRYSVKLNGREKSKQERKKIANDLEVLKEVGISAMPCSSPILDKFNPDYITKRRGGDGSFREFADLILEYRK